MDLKKKIAEIASTYGVTDVYVFGSRAKEIAARVQGGIVHTESSSSDVDLGVFPVQSTSWTPDKRVNLAMDLEDLFGVDRVDLVFLPEADPYLALDILRGELLYTKDPDQQARYELYVIRRADDLLPFKRERNRMILEEGAR